MEKARRKNKVYSAEFKINVIMDMREHCLGYRETMRKYFPHLEERNFNFLKQWERIYLEEGAEGLMKERRGKGSKGRPPKPDKKTEEDLIAENQRLRMENEYLKKLSALVLADERKNGKRRTSSRN